LKKKDFEMKILMLLAFLWVPANSQQPQAKCSAGSAPEIRGLTLGETIADVAQRLKGVRIEKADDLGETHLILKFREGDLSFKGGLLNLGESSLISTTNYPDFEGLERLEIESIDGRIYAIGVKYSTPPKWRNVNEFTTSLSTAFGLPVTAWEEDENSDGVMEIKCGKFQIRAKIEPSPVIRILDPAAPLILAARKVERDEKRRRAFRP
jgi:hypothetical protein